MTLNVLSAAVNQESRHWLSALELLPAERRDVYFQPQYLQPYANSTEIEACCAIYRSDEAILVYPFLKSRIEKSGVAPNTEKLQDIQSGYGYGGPVVSRAGEDPQFLQQAWSSFSEWCAEEQIVTEFVRFHPLLENVRWAPSSMRTFQDRVTIPIMLEPYSSTLQSTSYYRNHRQMLSKAGRMGFSFHVTDVHNELAWFVPMYQETQDFLQAGSDTRFGMEYFKTLTEGLGAQSWLGVVKQDDEIVAAALVLEGPTYLHSHLMGYRRDIQTTGMTNILYHGIALEGIGRGKTILHMGGGRTTSEQDSLFRFKQSLSPARANFWIGTRCHNQSKYEELGREWERRNGPRPKNYFQFHRLSPVEMT